MQHDIGWIIDTLGGFQSAAFDVWGTSPNNVYVAGFFYGSSPNTGTNIKRWDGQLWSDVPFWGGEIYSIFGFSENDVWVAGTTGGVPYSQPLFGHWDGQEWQKSVLDSLGYINGLWGTASDNLFAVSGDGKIFHHGTNGWSIVNQRSSVPLIDIWGITSESIYACGYDDVSGHGTLMHFDGINWIVQYDRDANSVERPNGFTSSVWGYDTSNVFLMTTSGEFVGNTHSWKEIFVPNGSAFKNQVRGSSFKNIFVVGSYGLVVHWNGKSWHRYDTLFRYSQGSGDNLTGLWALEGSVFVVGRTPNARGVIYRGVQ